MPSSARRCGSRFLTGNPGRGVDGAVIGVGRSVDMSGCCEGGGGELRFVRRGGRSASNGHRQAGEVKRLELTSTATA